MHLINNAKKAVQQSGLSPVTVAIRGGTDGADVYKRQGYSLVQNLIVGGQYKDGNDVTNDLSFMCIEASMHVHLPAPSLSIRVWNGSPHDLLIKAAELTRTGIGLPAYYNDEVIIPALQNRGLSLADAREYNIIGLSLIHI